MAIPLPAVTWRLRQTRLPRLRGRCAACAAASTFDPTGKFRVNANGKTIDVWLLLRCHGCGKVRKVTVVERSPVRSIDPALLRRYHDNDPGLVAEVLLAAPLHQRNRLTVDWEGAWVLDADPIPGCPAGPSPSVWNWSPPSPCDRSGSSPTAWGSRVPRRSGSGPTAGSGRRPAWTPAPPAASPSRSTIRGPADMSRYGRTGRCPEFLVDGAKRAAGLVAGCGRAGVGAPILGPPVPVEHASAGGSWPANVTTADRRGSCTPPRPGRWRTGHHAQPQ